MDDLLLKMAHFSDLHLIDHRTNLRFRDWLSKRAVGWLNSRIGRGQHFKHAASITRCLVESLPTRGLDGLLFSGDATTLGTHLEFRLVDEIMQPLIRGMVGIAVPGNHDHYVHEGVHRKYFEESFAPWQQGRRIDAHIYPFAREINGIWFVCVNSSQANFGFWDSRGNVGSAQLRRLELLLTQLPPGPKILLTHYPYRLGNGEPELRMRRLRDAGKLWEILRKHIVLWFHGHRHVRYHLVIPDSDCIDVCVGSATQEGRWSYHEYAFHRDRLNILHRMWNKTKHCFEDHATESLLLPAVWREAYKL